MLILLLGSIIVLLIYSGSRVSIHTGIRVLCYLNGVLAISGSLPTEEFLDHPEWALTDTAGEHCYFDYSFGYRRGGGIFEHHELLDRETGYPAGKARRKGYIYTRDFEYCTVWLDLESENAKITRKHQ